MFSSRGVAPERGRKAASRSATSFTYSQERTHSEPGECEREEDRKSHAAGTDLSGMVFAILFYGGAGEAQRHNKENDSCDLEPELVYDVTKRAHRRARRTHESVVRPAAAHLLSGDTRHNARFSPG